MTVKPAAPIHVWTVTELNEQVRQLLEGQLGLVWIEGELSNLARPASGHWYFSLKDEAAQVRCVMFRLRNRHTVVSPRAGMHVRAAGRVSLYPARGDFQLILEHLEEAGEGDLKQAFERLRGRLEVEGLFAPERKRPLPRFPRRVGVITSESGAALQDVLSVFARRAPFIPLIVIPALVQGQDAAASLCQALDRAQRWGQCDLLLMVRGGGSLEDLQAFNDEAVARAIAASPVPVVAGVGHEVDVTIVDLVADLRGATPSAAAEAASPHRRDWLDRIHSLERRLHRGSIARATRDRTRLEELAGRLLRQNPERLVQRRAQRLDESQSRLERAIASRVRRRQEILRALATRVHQQFPQRGITRRAKRLRELATRLNRAMERRIRTDRQRIAQLERSLGALGPQATLTRGYAIARQGDGGSILRRSDQVSVDQELTLILADGRLRCRVVAVDASPGGEIESPERFR